MTEVALRNALAPAYKTLINPQTAGNAVSLLARSRAVDPGKAWRRMTYRLRNLLILVLVSLTANFGLTQSTPQNAPTPEARPKIGLVLQGGGAVSYKHLTLPTILRV